jgi:hypothetical protein
MQFRLSTLFLIIFVVAASLAVFEIWGIAVAAFLLLIALYINRCKTVRNGIADIILNVILGSIFVGFFLSPGIGSRPSKRAWCNNNLKQISLALENYHEKHGHFPSVSTCDQNGKPLFSWREQILPQIECGPLYDRLRQKEPWDSPYNAKICRQASIDIYQCPAADREKNDCTTNYVAVIGPGTAWRKEGAVRLSDLPDGGSHTVMLVETVNSDIHWANPQDLTVEDALERMQDEQMGSVWKIAWRQMKKGSPLVLSTAHSDSINVIFADGTVRHLPASMPLSLWKKLFAGEVKDLDAVEDNSFNTESDLVDVRMPTRLLRILRRWPFLLSLLVWLFSVVLLFRRAVKSRGKFIGAAPDPPIGGIA